MNTQSEKMLKELNAPKSYFIAMLVLTILQITIITIGCFCLGSSIYNEYGGLASFLAFFLGSGGIVYNVIPLIHFTLFKSKKVKVFKASLVTAILFLSVSIIYIPIHLYLGIFGLITTLLGSDVLSVCLVIIFGLSAFNVLISCVGYIHTIVSVTKLNNLVFVERHNEGYIQ